MGRLATRGVVFLAALIVVYLVQSDTQRARAHDSPSHINQRGTGHPHENGAKPGEHSPAGRLDGEDELRWIIERLNLSEKQQADTKVLLESYRYRTGEGADVAHLNELLLAHQAAEAAGDVQRLAEVKAQLADARPDVKARRDFLTGLRLLLNVDQQRQLTAMQSFLKEFPSGRVTPLYIFKLARTLELSSEQLLELDRVHTQFRSRRIPQLGAPHRIPLSGVEVEFTHAVRAVLTREQKIEFDRELQAMRQRVQNTGGSDASEPPGR